MDTEKIGYRKYAALPVLLIVFALLLAACTGQDNGSRKEAERAKNDEASIRT